MMKFLRKFKAENEKRRPFKGKCIYKHHFPDDFDPFPIRQTTRSTYDPLMNKIPSSEWTIRTDPKKSSQVLKEFLDSFVPVLSPLPQSSTKSSCKSQAPITNTIPIF